MEDLLDNVAHDGGRGYETVSDTVCKGSSDCARKFSHHAEARAFTGTIMMAERLDDRRLSMEV